MRKVEQYSVYAPAAPHTRHWCALDKAYLFLSRLGGGKLRPSATVALSFTILGLCLLFFCPVVFLNGKHIGMLGLSTLFEHHTLWRSATVFFAAAAILGEISCYLFFKKKRTLCQAASVSCLIAGEIMAWITLSSQPGLQFSMEAGVFFAPICLMIGLFLMLYHNFHHLLSEQPESSAACAQ